MNKEKLRRTMLYAPGNNPAMLQNADIYGADSICFDLEDSVAISQKDSARYLVYTALTRLKFSCEVGVRINHISTPWGYEDLENILAARPAFIRLPKGETGEEIKEIDKIITKAEIKHGFALGSIGMVVSIENPRGLRNAYEIATASPRMLAIAIGGEDFAASLKTQRVKGNPYTGDRYMLAARSMLVFAAREAEVQVLDSVFSDIRDDEGLIEEVTLAKELGFDGKSCVNPRQVDIIHRVYTPTAIEIDYSYRVLAAYREALDKNSGVISLNGKMIDTPMVIRAERVLANAGMAGTAPKGGV